MKVFLNILWYFPYFGFLLAIPTAIGGLLLCLTIVGIPLGLGMLQIAKFLLAPHTYELVSQKDISAAKGEERNQLWVVFSTIVRILYFPIGLFVAIAYIFDAIICFITIIGIPNGLVMVKLIPAVFNPVGKVCVGGAIARKIREDKEQKEVNGYFGNTQSENTSSATPVSKESWIPEKPDTPRYYTDAKIDEVIANAKLYRPEIIEECIKEKEIRANIDETLPEIEAMPEEKLKEIVNSADTYSPLIVRCAEIILERLVERRAAEAAAERARQEEEIRLEQEAEEQRRKEKIQNVKDLLDKWKYVIGGSVAAIVVICFSLWYTSDSHRYNVAVDAYVSGDYNKVIEWTSKVDDKYSKYFQPALILGLRAKANSDVSDPLSKKTIANAQKLQERLNKYVETTPFNEKSYFAHVYQLQQIYNSINMSEPDTIADPQKWLKIANAFNNARFSGSDKEYFDNHAKFTAAYAYFMGGDYDRAEEIFESLEDCSDYTIPSYAKGYLGIMNLFKLVKKPCSRSDAYSLLREGPDEGILAMFKGDAYLVANDLRLRERITSALESYSWASVPEESASYMLQTRKDVIYNVMNTRSWEYYGYNFETSTGSCIYYNGPTADWHNDEPDGWGIYQNKMNNEILSCFFGQYIYRNGTTQFIHNLMFNLDSNDKLICAYQINDKYQWGAIAELPQTEQYLFTTNATELSLDMDPVFFYRTYDSPICNIDKADELEDKIMKEIMGEDYMEYED